MHQLWLPNEDYKLLLSDLSYSDSDFEDWDEDRSVTSPPPVNSLFCLP